MGKKILAIDDDIDILSIFQLVLEEDGFEVITSRIGISPEDLSLMLPDLILLDINIDGFPKSGVEICTEYKGNKAVEHVPVLLVSSEHNLEMLAASCKANGFLSKPFNIMDLTNKVKEFVSSEIN